MTEVHFKCREKQLGDLLSEIIDIFRTVWTIHFKLRIRKKWRFCQNSFMRTRKNTGTTKKSFSTTVLAFSEKLSEIEQFFQNLDKTIVSTLSPRKHCDKKVFKCFSWRFTRETAVYVRKDIGI